MLGWVPTPPLPFPPIASPRATAVAVLTAVPAALYLLNASISNMQRMKLRAAYCMVAIGWRGASSERNNLPLRGSGDGSGADDDVVVAVPGKSGTTWLMHIAHQIRMGGAPPAFDDQMDVIPWIDPFGPSLAIPTEECMREQCASPRVFKSHKSLQFFLDEPR
jgi:hypothetical protein|eukprot:SAG25_NODE_691_length_5916_cov_9.126698_4_plen_163_part_00